MIGSMQVMIKEKLATIISIIVSVFALFILLFWLGAIPRVVQPKNCSMIGYDYRNEMGECRKMIVGWYVEKADYCELLGGIPGKVGRWDYQPVCWAEPKSSDDPRCDRPIDCLIKS